MNRRHMLGTVAAGMASMGLVEGRAIAADDRQAHEGHHAGHLQKCMDTCADCMNECNMTVHYCYEKALHGSSKLLDPLHLAMDCQEFCGNSAKLIGRASPLMNVGCQACAEACDKCAGRVRKAWRRRATGPLRQGMPDLREELPRHGCSYRAQPRRREGEGRGPLVVRWQSGFTVAASARYNGVINTLTAARSPCLCF